MLGSIVWDGRNGPGVLESGSKSETTMTLTLEISPELEDDKKARPYPGQVRDGLLVPEAEAQPA